jgi:hypothetical protein
MSRYKVMKTTMGRKYRVRVCEDEVAERALFRAAVVLLPFVGSVLLMAVWLMRG